MTYEGAKTMEPKGIERFGAKRFSDYLSGQTPLRAADVRRTRALIAGFPLLAIVALAAGVSAGRAVAALFVFALVAAIQMLLLSPARRRQVVGLPQAEKA